MKVEPVLEIQNLKVELGDSISSASVLNGVNVTVLPSEIHGVVGESGSGKSVTARSVLGLLPSSKIQNYSGSVRVDGFEVAEMSEREMQDHVRGQVAAMIFQDPMTALNPTMRIGTQISLPMRRHSDLSKKDAWAEAIGLLHDVGIPEPSISIRKFPHEFSGGQRQRIMIAIALSNKPALLLADEPTTALDVTVQAQIMDLIQKMRKDRGMACLLVSHDLSLIAERCDVVSVMYAGRIIECGPAQQVFMKPLHPYTDLLEKARPNLDDPPHTMLETIPGSPPSLRELPTGCAFAARCPLATDRCREVWPEMTEISPGRSVACHYPLKVSGLESDSVAFEGVTP